MGMKELGWERQASILADLFAGELHQSKDQYMDSLPQFPKRVIIRSNQASVIVETRIPQTRLLEIIHARVDCGDPKYIEDWQDDPRHFTSPRRPYVSLLTCNVEEVGMMLEQSRTSLTRAKRGGNFHEGIFFLLLEPEVIDHKKYGLACIGSQINPGGRTPGAGIYQGQIVATWYRDDYSYKGKGLENNEIGVIPLTAKR